MCFRIKKYKAGENLKYGGMVRHSQASGGRYRLPVHLLCDCLLGPNLIDLFSFGYFLIVSWT